MRAALNLFDVNHVHSAFGWWLIKGTCAQKAPLHSRPRSTRCSQDTWWGNGAKSVFFSSELNQIVMSFVVTLMSFSGVGDCLCGLEKIDSLPQIYSCEKWLWIYLHLPQWNSVVKPWIKRENKVSIHVSFIHYFNAVTYNGFKIEALIYSVILVTKAISGKTFINVLFQFN